MKPIRKTTKQDKAVKAEFENHPIYGYIPKIKTGSIPSFIGSGR